MKVSSYEYAFDQIAHVAAPYVIFWQESASHDGVIIELTDEDRGRPEKSRRTIVTREKIASTGDVGGLFTRAVVYVKKKLQEDLAAECDEPEMRLWLAHNRDADLMDNSPVPAHLRKLWNNHLNPPAPKRRIVKKAAEEKEAESVAVKTSRGVPTKEQKRVPQCPVHHVPMAFHEDRNKWKCPEDGCRLASAPTQDSAVGRLIMGRGQLDLRIVYPENGGEPSLILMADNNVAMDITSITDMSKFQEYNDYVSAAARAKRAGESVTSVRNNYASAMIRINKPAKVYGCEHS